MIVAAIVLTTCTATATTDPPLSFFSTNTPKALVEFELMTWPEVYRAIHHEGKTTALFYTGGTESRGPQNVNGGHNIMARATVKAIAEQLGNAIAMPVLPFSPNTADAQLTGTIGLTNDILAAVLERVSEEAITTGFRNVILIGDHGAGQPNVYAAVAKKLNDRYAAQARTARKPQDVHVFYCDEAYAKAQDDYEAMLKSKGLPTSTHAGIQDTSELMYLQGRTQDYTRLDLLPVAVTIPATSDPKAPQPVPSGVRGDGRQSTVDLGKMAFDNKVNHAVRQIKQLLGEK
jgi:creatinine amidohydrolase/Fe(II)-dependent formamide hydrolase-like protein